MRNPNVLARAVSEKQQTSITGKHQQNVEFEGSSEEDYSSVEETSNEESEDDSNSSETLSEGKQEEESENELEETTLSVDKMRRKKMKKPESYGLGQTLTRPTKAQLAARNGLSKKLPTFSGNPEEWPLFIGSYDASNIACGFNDVENLVRLQESLKGSALESVRGQLLLPKSVPKVISKLRQLFGRPEQLLHCHLEKSQAAGTPESG